MECDWDIRPMEPADLEELIRLHAQYLNYGDGIYAHFQAALADQRTVAVKCVHAGRMVGLDIYTRGIALSGGHPDLCAQVRALAGDAVVLQGTRCWWCRNTGGGALTGRCWKPAASGCANRARPMCCMSCGCIRTAACPPGIPWNGTRR